MTNSIMKVHCFGDGAEMFRYAKVILILIIFMSLNWILISSDACTLLLDI